MAVWTYSDWVTYDDGAAKLTRVRLHIQEVSNELANPSYATDGLSVSRRDGLNNYLAALNTEAARLSSVTGKRVGWASGQAVL